MLLDGHRGSTRVQYDEGLTSTTLKDRLAANLGLEIDDFYLTRNGRSLNGDDTLNEDDVVRVSYNE